MHQLSQLNLLLKFNEDCMDRLLKLWSNENQSRLSPRKLNYKFPKNLSIRLSDVTFQHDEKIFGNVNYEFKSGEHIQSQDHQVLESQLYWILSWGF